eukprot:scaffold113253_cov19-Tisochrysis_lutea.AAC.1
MPLSLSRESCSTENSQGWTCLTPVEVGAPGPQVGNSLHLMVSCTPFRARGPSPAISKSSREEGRQLARAALLSSKQGRGSSSSSWAAAAAAVCYTGEGALDPFEWEEAGSVFYVRGRHLRMPARTLMQRKRAKHAAQNNYNPVMHTFTD